MEGIALGDWNSIRHMCIENSACCDSIHQACNDRDLEDTPITTQKLSRRENA